jgi:hypothetical protein
MSPSLESGLGQLCFGKALVILKRPKMSKTKASAEK